MATQNKSRPELAPASAPQAQASPQASGEDRTVCFCHNVSLFQLKAAIAAGAHTLEEIQAQTCASTGCGGCQFEVEDVLAESR